MKKEYAIKVEKLILEFSRKMEGLSTREQLEELNKTKRAAKRELETLLSEFTYNGISPDEQREALYEDLGHMFTKFEQRIGPRDSRAFEEEVVDYYVSVTFLQMESYNC